MFRLILITASLTYLTLALKQNTNFLSDEFIASINARQSSWTAGRNFDDDPQMMSVVKKLVSSVSLGEELPSFSAIRVIADDNFAVIPDSFDARDQWPNCTTIEQVWDQGVCSSGWAVSAASVLSDRICIQKSQTENPVLSPEDLLSCCTKCRFDCDGGWPNFAWEHFNETGVTTGGTYGSNIGCKSYSLSPCSHFNGTSQYPSCSSEDSANITTCSKTCDNSAVIYEDNIYYAQQNYRIEPNSTQIKLEIMQNGPVQATFAVWENFVNYKNGVYIETVDSGYLGTQSAKLIGWGTDENNQSYWLGLNSWNTEWGDSGLFKWLVDNSDSTIESQVYGALPYFPES